MLDAWISKHLPGHLHKAILLLQVYRLHSNQNRSQSRRVVHTPYHLSVNQNTTFLTSFSLANLVNKATINLQSMHSFLYLYDIGHLMWEACQVKLLAKTHPHVVSYTDMLLCHHWNKITSFINKIKIETAGFSDWISPPLLLCLSYLRKWWNEATVHGDHLKPFSVWRKSLIIYPSSHRHFSAPGPPR